MVELSLFEFHDKLKSGSSVIDTRSPQEFASGFVPGSIFFSEDISPLQFSTFIEKGTPLLIIGDSLVHHHRIEELEVLGFEIQGIFSGNIEDWKDAGNSIDLIVVVEADELAMDLRFDQTLVLVDIRDGEKYKHSHVKKAMSMPLPEMADVAQIASLDEEGCIYFYAAEDADAMLAGSLLKKQGLHNLRVVNGGWKAIVEEQSIEIEKEAKLKK